MFGTHFGTIDTFAVSRKNNDFRTQLRNPVRIF